MEEHTFHEGGSKMEVERWADEMMQKEETPKKKHQRRDISTI
jgi:hypothetical protein